MVTSKCEAEIGLFLTAIPKKKKEERRKGRARGSMSEREKQVGREKENLEKQIFFVSKW
jgi:hypothetical protein